MLPLFLHLPEELRQSIYEMALGGHIVHFGHRAWGRRAAPTIRVCGADVDEWDILNSLDAPSASQPSYRSYHRRHGYDETARCCKGASVAETVCLDLLLSCKQVHAEARMVPFTHNAFGIHNPSEIGHLGDRVGHERFRQIRHIIVYITGGMRDWGLGSRASRGPALSCDLSRLSTGQIRTLDIFIELYLLDENHLTTIRAQDRRVRGLQTFRRIRPKRVRVFIDERGGLGEEGWKKLKLVEFDGAAWAKRIKHLILEGTECGENGEGVKLVSC